ncbi:MAG TPA: calcium-binding protein [Humisphaera sp.]
MHVQTLESRTLFSVSAADIHDTLYVWGDAGNNGLSVERAGSDLVVKKYVGGSGYAEFFRTPAAGVTQVRVYGYAGADTISINDNVTLPVTVFGGKGADYIKGGGGPMNDLWGHGNWAGDADHGPASDDGAADTIVSGQGYAVQHGQKGDDLLFTDQKATSGYDVMYGGDGNDKLYARGHGDNAYAFGEAGDDRFYPSQGATQTASFYGGAGLDMADYRAWNAAIQVKPNGGTPCGLRYGDRHQILQDDVEIVYGTEKGDAFAGTDKRNVFFGRGGNDEMSGAGGDDQLYGEGGDDVVQGGDGNDMIVGGDGNDRLYGQGGNDNVNGGAGDDRLEGGDGADSLWGNAGNDTLLGDAGNDKLHGGDGSDELRGGSGGDALFGDRDPDWLYGDAGNDLLVGGHGSDFLVAKDYLAGNDAVFGDDQDGANAAGSFDIALVDVGSPLFDFVHGVESVSF